MSSCGSRGSQYIAGHIAGLQHLATQLATRYGPRSWRMLFTPGRKSELNALLKSDAIRLCPDADSRGPRCTFGLCCLRHACLEWGPLSNDESCGVDCSASGNVNAVVLVPTEEVGILVFPHQVHTSCRLDVYRSFSEYSWLSVQIRLMTRSRI